MTIAISLALLALGAIFGFALAMVWASAKTIREAEKGGWIHE